MPHQCTNCSETFADGSKEMLSGCPNCGHNTFQYIPEGADPETVTEEEEPPEPPVDEDSMTGKVSRAAASVSEYVRGNEGRPSDPKSGSSSTETSGESFADEEREDAPEDRAQASARTDVANVSDLQPSPSERTETSETEKTAPADPETAPPRDDARVAQEPEDGVEADIEDLREELNDQFESIRIVEPGQYELNLMELYDREEHIVALREDGKYVIEVPETWRDGEED
jgi:predicted  nucleic acid-binding Zn-ribbon protein